MDIEAELVKILIKEEPCQRSIIGYCFKSDKLEELIAFKKENGWWIRYNKGESPRPIDEGTINELKLFHGKGEDHYS